MARDLVTVSNENLRRSFVTLAEETPSGEVRQFGPLVAPSAGLEAPLYNRVFVFEPPPRADVSAAVAWMVERDVPFWVTVSESVVEAIDGHLDDLGLVKIAEQPGMAMASLDGIPPRNSIAELVEVTDPDELDDFVPVAASAFETPLAIAEQVYQAALGADEGRLFLGRVDGHPAACGLLIQSGDVAGVYTIGVVEEFRRKGIGEAMTWELLRNGREDGCQVGVLQSSEMAYPLYVKMGFETVVTYHHFGPAP